MSPLIRKEIRLLSPHFALGLALIALIWLVPRGFSDGTQIGLVGLPLLILCPIFAVLMTLGSFGTELSSGLCASLLTQPVPRARIWWTKSMLLTLFMAALWCAWWLVFESSLHHRLSSTEISVARTLSLLLAAAFLTGGLWTALLVRTVITSFWLTILAPALLFMFTETVLEGRVPHPQRILMGLLGLYSVAGFAVAYHAFRRLRDVEPSLASITETGRAWLRFPFAPKNRLCSPGIALLSKEMLMHQGLVGFGLAVVLLHLGVIGLRASVMLADRSPAVDLLCENFWAIWLIFPLLIGCQLLAEERRLGLWANQLSLPFRRSHQLLIKALVACVLAVFLGAVLPVVLEQNQLLSDSRFDPSAVLKERSQLVSEGGFSTGFLLFAQGIQALPFHPEPLFRLTLISLGLLLIAGFASSLTRSLFQALTTAFAGMVGLLMITILTSESSRLPELAPFRSLVGLAIPVCTLLAAVLWLAFRNAYQAEVGPTLWRRNVAVVIIAFVSSGAAASLVYHRAWERLTQLEPPHGTAVLRPDDQVRIESHWRALAFTAADGRSWSADHESDQMTRWRQYFGRPGVGTLAKPIFQLQGSNWAQVVHCGLDTIGIQKDGSLWVSDAPQLRHISARSHPSGAREPFQMVRYGKNQDWKQAVNFRTGALLLATNGTLWVWEKAKMGATREYQGLAEEVPFVLSPETGWTDLRSTPTGWGFGFELLKQDGSAWIQPSQEARLSDRMKLDENTELSRAAYLDSGRAHRRAVALRGSDWTEPFQVGVSREGRLEVVAAWRNSKDARRWTFLPTSIPLGEPSQSRWIDVASGAERGTLVSLRADGTLWKWRFRTSPVTAPRTAQATRLGIHSDWVALAPFQNDIITLAGDGSLWVWQFEPPFESGYTPLLGASSKPRLLGNILTGSR